jgi:hypothetical protein
VSVSVSVSVCEGLGHPANAPVGGVGGGREAAHAHRGEEQEQDSNAVGSRQSKAE